MHTQVRFAFDADDPALASGDAAQCKLLSPSPLALRDTLAASVAGGAGAPSTPSAATPAAAQ